MQDADLVARVRAGDGEAFGALVERHQGRIFALCDQFAGNSHDAEDLAHEAFITAYLKLAQLRESDRFGAWVQALALNHCRRWHRERRSEGELPDDPPCPPAVGSPVAGGRMPAALSQLSPAHRVVLVLHYWEGLAYEAVARFLDLPIGTVMSRMHRARRELKRRLEQAEEETMTVGPEAGFREEVEAEVRALKALAGQDATARERLAVLLRQAPERWVQLLREAESDASLADLARLLRRLGADILPVTLACVQGADPLLRERSRALLRAAVTGARIGPGSPRGARIARAEAYLLLDELFRSALGREARANLLSELMLASADEPTIVLLTRGLLCDPEAALDCLMARYRETGTAEAAYRQPDLLYALARAGTRFVARLLPLFDGSGAGRELALAGAEGLARALYPDWLEASGVSAEDWAREATFRRKWAPPLAADRDPALLSALAERVAAFLADPRPAIRERAIRTLGLLRVPAHRPALEACARHDEPATRLAALRALAELGDAAAESLFGEVARAGSEDERCAAIWALGRLRAVEAAPLLGALARAAPPAVRQASVVALGQMGGDAALAELERIAGLPETEPSRVAGIARHFVRVARGEVVPRPVSPPTCVQERVRQGARPPFHIAIDAALRALPAIRSYEEAEITRLIAQACADYSSTRRYLVDEGLMTREKGRYRFTTLGEAVWRVERFLLDHYLR
jgi:RNA polymerase sigma-70 factor (ECF subfamily)